MKAVLDRRAMPAIFLMAVFLAGVLAVAVPVSAERPTVVVSFTETADRYKPDGNLLYSVAPYEVEAEFVKTGRTYYIDLMWVYGPPEIMETLTGSPVVISQGSFACWTKYTSAVSGLPVIHKARGELTITLNDEGTGTMSGEYFDHIYCICDDPDTVLSYYPFAQQVGNSNMWYLAYTEYTVYD